MNDSPFLEAINGDPSNPQDTSNESQSYFEILIASLKIEDIFSLSLCNSCSANGSSETLPDTKCSVGLAISIKSTPTFEQRNGRKISTSTSNNEGDSTLKTKPLSRILALK